MKFRLTIDCDNAAFEEDPGAELARLLGHVASLLDAVVSQGVARGGYSRNVVDLNGNTVGKWEVK